MSVEMPSDGAAYRVTLFFGPEPVEDRPDTQCCVFNVKKRSWKAGVQVAVEVASDQLGALQQQVIRDERLKTALSGLSEEERLDREGRVPDLAAQAIAWCKLDLLLATGLPQENQRIEPHCFRQELEDSVRARQAYVVTYIMTELDLIR